MNKNIKIVRKKRVGSFFHPFFIFLLSNILLISEAKASFDFNQKLESAYTELVKLRIINGQNIIRQSQKESHNNGIAVYLENYGEVLELFISEDPAFYDKAKKNEEERIKKIIKLPQNSPYYLFTQAEIKIHWGFIKLKFGDEVSAVWNIRQAYKLLQENKKKYPQFLPNNKSLGLLNIMMGSIPEKYSSVVNLIGMNGDINKGIEQLNSVAESNNIYQLEAKIFKVLTENYILKKGFNDLSYVKGIYESNKDNLAISFLYSSLLLKNAKNDDALKILQNRPSTSEYISFPYLHFTTGEIHLFKGQYAKAREYYLKFSNTTKGKNFIKDANYKIFLSYWLNNEDENAKIYLNKILKNGNTLYDTDKYAQKFAEKGEMPNKNLMKARLFFDGGYYNQALETINRFDSKTAKNQQEIVEYYYRKGRIYHQLHNYSNASIYYLKTIAQSKNNSYFAPNSALQMGYIYKEQNNKELARIYFQKALSYQNYEYKNSIDNKARAALNELKKK